jgi:hypothetical protein
MIHFDQPWWLLAAVAGVGPVALAIRAARRGRRQAAWAVAMQCLAVALAAAALAQPSIPRSRTGLLPWLVLRDVSASTAGQDSNTRAVAPGWPAELPFAESNFGAGRTLLVPALHEAIGRAGELAGAVFITDGQWQDDQWEEAAAALRRTGLPVLIVPLASPPADARIEEFHAARRADGRVTLRLQAAATLPQTRKITIRRRGSAEAMMEKTATLLPGEGFAASLADAAADPASPDAIVYQASLDGTDAFPQNDAATAVVPPAVGRTAIVAADTRTGSPAAAAARLFGDADVIRPADAPVKADGWAAYNLVVVCDPAGDLFGAPGPGRERFDRDRLAAERRVAIARFVRDGGGMILVGTGPHAESRDRQDPLNQVAALVPNPYERRPLRVIVVLDASGSMGEPAGPAGGGRRKYDLAVEAVVSTRRHLTPRDTLAVIAFSDSARRVYDSGQAPPDFAALREAMAKVQPGGPTVAATALEEATGGPAAGSSAAPGHAAAPAEKDARELLIVVSDLASQPFDEAAMARRFRARNMDLAVVAVQAGAAPAPARASLRILAEALNAPLALQEDMDGLAEVFGRFIRRGRGDVIRRGEFRLAAPGPVFGVDVSRMPAADAYVLSAPREGAEVLASIGDDPVIARRLAGLGRSVSLALPLDASTNAALLPGGGATPAAGGFADLLRSAGEWARRTAFDARFSCELDRADGDLRLAVEAAQDGRPMNLLKLAARLAAVDAPSGPAGAGPAPAAGDNIVQVPLQQVAPGRYEARLGDASRAFIVQLVDANGGRTIWRGAWGASREEEFAAIGPNWANLNRLAVIVDGRIEPAGGLRAAGGDSPDKYKQLVRRQYAPIAGPLLAIAAALMLLEWAAARIARR